MKILIACEFSGILREAFAEKGHDAWSCDLLPTERPGNHIKGDVRDILDDGWDMMIAHPPVHLSRQFGSAMATRKTGKVGEAKRSCRFLQNPIECSD